jgi:gas vesicle protein GvpA/GvpJ/GvpM family
MSLVRKPAGVELIDLLDRVLDKGIVIEASSRLHLSGTNLSRQKKHVSIVSIETFMDHSEARVVAKMNKRQPLRSLEHAAQPVLRSKTLP